MSSAARHTDVVGNLQPAVAQSFVDAVRCLVVARQNRRAGLAPGQQRLGVDVAHFGFIFELEAAQPRLQAGRCHGATIAVIVPGKPRQAHVADKPDIAMAQADQVFGHLLAALNIVGIHRVALHTVRLSDHVVSQHRIGDSLVVQQLQQILRVGSGQHHRPHHVMALHYLRQVQFLPGNMRRIVEREEHHVPAIGGAVGLRPQQNSGMKSMQHGAIAQQKGQRLGLVPLRQIDIQLGRRIQHHLPDGWIDTIVPVQYPRNRGHADVGFRRNLP